jgi:hypothetical protein
MLPHTDQDKLGSKSSTCSRPQGPLAAWHLRRLLHARLRQLAVAFEEREEELRVAAERAKMLPHTDQDKLVNISVVLTSRRGEYCGSKSSTCSRPQGPLAAWHLRRLLHARQHHVPSREIIILPLLFTAGMTALDSLDSVFMLSAYTTGGEEQRQDDDLA